MGFGPMAARGDAAAPQRLTMEDWMSRSAVFRQQNPQLAPRVTAATTQPTTAATTPAQTPYYGGSDVENQSTGGKAFSEMTNQELRDYSDRRNNGNIFERNLEYAVPGLQMLGIPGFAMRGLEKSQLEAEYGNRGLSNPGDFVGGQIAGAANTGMNMAGGMAKPELAGRSDLTQMGLDAQIAAAEAAGQAGDPTMGGGVGVNAADLGAEPNAPGMFARGGVVRRKDMRGPDPKGPDQGFVGVHAGEMILNKPQQAALARALMGRRR